MADSSSRGQSVLIRVDSEPTSNPGAASDMKSSPGLHKCYSFPRFQPTDADSLEVPGRSETIREDYGSTGSINSMARSSGGGSAASLDVHAPSLPPADSLVLGGTLYKRSESCPCIARVGSAGRILVSVAHESSCAKADAAPTSNHQLGAVSAHASSASARCSPAPEQRRPHLATTGLSHAVSERHVAGTGTTTLGVDIDSGSVMSQSVPSPSPLRRRVNGGTRSSKRKCEEWLNQLPPEEEPCGDAAATAAAAAT